MSRQTPVLRCAPALRRALLAGISLLATALCAAQTPGPAPAAPPPAAALQVGPVYTAAGDPSRPKFPRIDMLVLASGPQGGPMAPADLTLQEDDRSGGHALGIVPFGDTGFGVAAVVAVDVSGSMAGSPLKIIRDSLYRFVSDARSQDSVGVLTIADDAQWDVPFGSDPGTLKARLQNLHARGTQTRLYDGLLTAIGTFGPEQPQRRVLTLISDGHDEGSRASLQQVLQMAREHHIAIDTIGLSRGSQAFFSVLKTLALQNGGSFHQVASDAELQNLIAHGMSGLKAQPVAVFDLPITKADGRLHHLAVQWRGGAQTAGAIDFTAPKATGPVPFVKDHLPLSLAVIALACGALVAGLMAERNRRRRRRARAVFAPALGAASHPAAAFRPRTETSFEDGPGNSDAKVRRRDSTQAAPPVTGGVAAGSRAGRATELAGVLLPADGVVAQLQATTGTLAGQAFPVPRGEFRIGAAPGNHLGLADDPTVSGRHATLVYQEPILILEDLQSTNGTRVNGELLRGARRPLRVGDEIQIGRTLFRLLAAG